MLNVVFFTFNPFEENTYLLSNEHNQCWIIDPGMYTEQEAAQMSAYITKHDLVPQGIINTHAHIDHILGIQTLTEKYGLSFGMHELELPVLERATDSAMMFGLNMKQAPKATYYIKEGVELLLGDDALAVYHTPGHSPGSISFYYPIGGWVISGDVLFSGGIGRTDLPGGNFDTLINSIKSQLFVLPDETTVFPGHGPATTIGDEKRDNGFLQ